MNRIYCTLLSIFIATAATNAQQVTKLSLKDCMDYAIMHNYSVKNSKIDILIQQAQVKQQLSASYPHINGKAELDDFYIPQSQFVDAHSFNPAVPEGTIQPISFTVPYAGSVGVTTSQLLFDGGVLIAWKARQSVMELARQNSVVTEETVRYNVYKAYNSLVIAYRQFDIIKRSLIYARSMEHDIMVTQQNGFAEKIDVERTSVQVNNLATDSIRIGNLLTTTEQVLKYQMGMDIKTSIVLTDTAVEDRKEATLALLNEQEQYDRVPEYNVLNTALKLSQYNVMRYKLAAIPSLSAFWAYGANYGSNKFNDVLVTNKYWASSTIGVQMNVPIFNGWLRTNQLKEAKLNVEKTQNNIEYLKQSLDFQTEMSRTTLKNAMLQVQSQRRNMDLANDVLDLAQRKYKAGVGSNIEVTQAQTDQLRAQTNYFSVLLDLINAQADLKKALGLMK
jgi:outer membrane protein TolC